MIPPSGPGRPFPWKAVEPGRLLLDLRGHAAELALARDGGVRLRASAGAQLSPDPAPHVGRAAVPLARAEPFEREAGAVAMAFEGPEGAAEVEISRRPFSVAVRSRRGELLAELVALELHEAGGGRVALRLPPESLVLGPAPRTDAGAAAPARVRLRTRARRIGPGAGAFPVSAPFLLVLSRDSGRSRAAGLLFDVFGEVGFHLGGEEPDRVEVAFAHGDLDLLFLPGPEPLAVLRRLAVRTGPPRCPPASALRPRLRLRRVPGRGGLARLEGRLRALDLSAGGFVLPEGARCAALPGRDEPGAGPAAHSVEVRPALRLRRAPELAELPPCRDAAGLPARVVAPGGRVLLPDLARPEARAAWARTAVENATPGEAAPPDLHLVGAEPEAWRRGLALGARVLPLGGDRLAGVRQRPPWAEGPVPLEAIRNLYALDAARGLREALDAAGSGEARLLTAASGTIGSTRHAPLVLRAPASRFGDLRAGVRALLSLACAGVAPCSLEVGGYRGRPGPELYLRWLEAGLLQPLLWLPPPRPGHRNPLGLPRAALARARALLELRRRLEPVVVAALLETARTGAPPWRPAVLDFPDDPGCREAEDHVLVGGRILTALVLEPGVAEREVSLPPGTWIDYHDDALHRGPRRIRVAAPPGRPVLLVRAGSALPVDAPAAGGRSGADGTHIEIFPAADGSSEIPVPGGPGPGPAIRHVSVYGRAAGRLRIEVGAAPEAGAGHELLHLRVRAAPRPRSVRVDASPVPESGPPPSWRHAGGRLELRIPDGGRGCLVEVEPAP